jgi:hypothetical protein
VPVQKRRTGRPPGDPTRVKLVAVGLRISTALKRRIDEACRTSGYSVAKEIENCVTQALDAQVLYGGPRLAEFWRRLADAAIKIEARLNRGSTFDDYLTFVETRKAWRRLIDELEPRQQSEIYDLPVAGGGRMRIELIEPGAGLPGSGLGSLAQVLHRVKEAPTARSQLVELLAEALGASETDEDSAAEPGPSIDGG